jgi:hypothetical protein
VALGFCITSTAGIFALELKQLKGGVNPEGKEVKFAARADFAYIGQIGFM